MTAHSKALLFLLEHARYAHFSEEQAAAEHASAVKAEVNRYESDIAFPAEDAADPISNANPSPNEQPETADAPPQTENETVAEQSESPAESETPQPEQS